MKEPNKNSELLRAGYDSYHKALFAVMEFRREVGETIQTVVEKRAPELAAAMEMDKNELLGGISPYTQPDRLTQKYDGSAAEIGIRIPKSLGWPWLLYFYFFISRDDDQPKLIAQIFLRNPGSELVKLAGSCKELERNERNAWISEIIPTDGSRDLSTVCDALLDRWIEVWKKVGGLRQFLPEKV
jgi:hypothetical protein